MRNLSKYFIISITLSLLCLGGCEKDAGSIIDGIGEIIRAVRNLSHKHICANILVTTSK